MAIGKTKPYHHGNLKQALVDAALDIIAKDGIEGISLREVSRLAGASHAAPYRHFKDKTELLAAVAEAGFVQMLAQVKQATKSKDSLERVETVATAYLRFATKHVAHFRVMYARELGDRSRYPGLLAAEQATTEFMHEVIVTCQKAGFMVDRDPEEIAIATWCAFHGAADLYNNAQLPPALSVKRLGDMIMKTLSHGFLKPSKRSRP